MKNDVSSFFYYMWNKWSEDEAKIVFADSCGVTSTIGTSGCITATSTECVVLWIACMATLILATETSWSHEHWSAMTE